MLVLAWTATERDTLLIYFAGHGERLTVNDRDDVYLVTSTFDADQVMFYADAQSSLRWLRRMFFGSRCRAKPVLLIFDCCYAGNFDRTTPTHKELFAVFKALLSDPACDDAPRNAVRVVLTAASHDAAAHERDGHSVFTAALLNALNGTVVEILDANDNLTLGRLTDYLKQRLPDQHPNLYGEQPSAPVVLRRHEHESQIARQRRDDAVGRDQRHTERKAMLVRSSEIVEDRRATFVRRITELAEISQRIAAPPADWWLPHDHRARWAGQEQRDRPAGQRRRGDRAAVSLHPARSRTGLSGAAALQPDGAPDPQACAV